MKKSLKRKILESIIGSMGEFKVSKKAIKQKYLPQPPYKVGTQRKKKPKTYGKNKGR